VASMLNRWRAGRLHSWSPFLCAQSAAHRAETGAANAVDVPLGAFLRAPFAPVTLMGRLPGISTIFWKSGFESVPLAPSATTAPGHGRPGRAAAPERAVRPDRRLDGQPARCVGVCAGGVALVGLLAARSCSLLPDLVYIRGCCRCEPVLMLVRHAWGSKARQRGS
jgi:hypothetical protein